MDTAVAAFSDVTDPGAIVLQLANGAAQIVAHHLGLGFMAPAFGELVAQTLRPEVDSPSNWSSALKGLQAFDVTVDVGTGRLTPAVREFGADELAAMLQDKTQGISPRELARIAAAIKLRQLSISGRLRLCTEELPAGR